MAVRQFYQHADSTENPGAKHAFVCFGVINYIAGILELDIASKYV